MVSCFIGHVPLTLLHFNLGFITLVRISLLRTQTSLLRAPSRVARDAQSSAALFAWLSALRLEHWLPALKELGFDDLGRLSLAEPQDLEACCREGLGGEPSFFSSRSAQFCLLSKHGWNGVCVASQGSACGIDTLQPLCRF